MSGFLLEIADVVFSVESRGISFADDYDPYYRRFIIPASTRPPDMKIVVGTRQEPERPLPRKIFESGDSWSLHGDPSDMLIRMTMSEKQDGPYWLAGIDPDFKKAVVDAVGMPPAAEGTETVLSCPVRYPLDQILLMYLLSFSDGAVIHAAGCEIGGRGFIFPGRSGAGKSTLIKNIAGLKNGEILSDDRIVVRKNKAGWDCFGTPWPGDAGTAVNRGAPLSAICFIMHGRDNRLVQISRAEAARRLIPVVSIPWYDRESTDRILSVIDRMVADIPSYEFYFRPDEKAADFIERFASEDCRTY